MDLFLTNMQVFMSQDANWWTGVMWIIVMFLADWTLILTAPIHGRGSIGEQVMQCYISPNLFPWRNKIPKSWMTQVWVNFQQILNIGMNRNYQTVAGPHWFPFLFPYCGSQWEPSTVWLPTFYKISSLCLTEPRNSISSVLWQHKSETDGKPVVS